MSDKGNYDSITTETPDRPSKSAERSKKSDTKSAGQEQIQAAFDEAQEKGYFGETPDPHPNEAWSLESGPDSPSAVEDHKSRQTQHPLEKD